MDERGEPRPQPLPSTSERWESFRYDPPRTAPAISRDKRLDSGSREDEDLRDEEAVDGTSFPTVAATRRTTGSVNLDSDAFRRADAELRAERNRAIGDERRAIGDWHSHPFHVDTAAERAKINQPSAADLRAWSSDLSGFADHSSSLTSLIVTRRDGAFNGSWVNPHLSAWITRHARSSFGERMVCEPAIVSGR